MPLSDIHFRLYVACLIYALAMGGWSFYLSFKNRPLDSNFWGALVVNEILFVAVGMIDVILIVTGGIVPERPWVHLLYTATGLLTIPAAYTFTQGRATAREAGIYGAVCLFLAGIAIRAIITSIV
jgi:hypothetical protein